METDFKYIREQAQIVGFHNYARLLKLRIGRTEESILRYGRERSKAKKELAALREALEEVSKEIE